MGTSAILGFLLVRDAASPVTLKIKLGVGWWSGTTHPYQECKCWA